MVPKRIVRALEEAGNFEDYRQRRIFRYLHLYSGPRDMLKQEIEAEAQKARLRVECVSLDRKLDPGMDIGTVKAHSTLRARFQKVNGMGPTLASRVGAFPEPATTMFLACPNLFVTGTTSMDCRRIRSLNKMRPTEAL